MQGTDCVFHLAALWLYECVHEPRKALDVNVVGTYNVDRGGARGRRQEGRLLVVGVGLRRRASTSPMTEEHPFNNRTMYGATKIAGEQFFRAFHEQHGLDYVGLRYMNVYGPRMDYKGTYVSVIMKVLDRIEDGRAAGDLRRRLAGVRLRPRRGRRARQHPVAEEPTRPTSSSTSASGSRRRSTSWSSCCSRSPARTSSPSTGRRSRCSSRTASAARRRPSGCSASAPRSALREGSVGRRVAAGDSAAARPRPSHDRDPLQGCRFPITKPLFGPEELERCSGRSRRGWVVQGPYVRRVRGALRGVRRCRRTRVATTLVHHRAAPGAGGARAEAGRRGHRAGVHLGRDGERRRVHGRAPVFCDIDLRDVQHRPRAVRVADRTDARSAIIPVHLFGLCADMDAIGAIAERHGLWVVEDAACALRRAVSAAATPARSATSGCFSFHPRKSITTGEGGMVTTDRAELARAGALLRDHGASRSDLDAARAARGAFLLADYPHLGYNYRMTDIQAALGCAQMDRAEWVLDRAGARRAARYDEALAGLDWLARPSSPAGYEHGYQSYVCLFAPGGADLDDCGAAARAPQRADGAMEAQRHRHAPGHARAGRSPASTAASTASGRGLPNAFSPIV